jgi:hypothetical protein
MQEPNGLNDEQRELESALRSLSPAAARIDPIAAAFNAGHRSSGHQLRIWRSAAALILLIAVASRLMPSGHNTDIQPHELTESTIALRSPQLLPEPAAPQSLMVLQQIVRERGLDALPPVNLPGVQVISTGNIF